MGSQDWPGGAGGASSYDSRETILDTIFVSVGSTILTIILSTLASYALSRMAQSSEFTILRTGGLDPTTARRLDRQRWGRVAGVASNILTLLIAVPFFLKRLPGGMMQSTMKAAPIAAAGLAASAMAPIVSMPGLPVWLGAFVPSLLLLPVAIAMLSGIRS